MKMLNTLEQIIAERRTQPSGASYTSRLFEGGTPRIAQKVGEEAVEVVVAALSQSRREQIGELADLLFHAMVLMHQLGIASEEVNAELERRHRPRTTGASDE